MRWVVFLGHILLLCSVPSLPQAQSNAWSDQRLNLQTWYVYKSFLFISGFSWVVFFFYSHRNLTNTEWRSPVLISCYNHGPSLYLYWLPWQLGLPPFLLEPPMPWLTEKITLVWSGSEFANESHHSGLGTAKERLGLYEDNCGRTTGNWFSWAHT